MKQYSQQQLKYLNENFQQGQRALQAGLFSRAEKYFLDVLKVGPDIIEANSALALAYAATKQHAKAIVQFELVLKANPKNAHTHHNLANCLYEQELYDDAVSHYHTALRINPSLVDSHIHCGIAYRKLKNYESAIQCLHQALNLDKRNAKAFHTLGVIYAEIDDQPRALECLENATGLAPNYPEFRLSFAHTLEKNGLDLEAGIQYHLTCESNPDYLDGFILYGNYLKQHHRYDEALECLTHAVQLAPQDLDIFDQLGQTYLGMGNTDAALIKFDAALKKEPLRLSSLNWKGQLFQEFGQLESAIEICDKIIAIDANKPDGYLLKSRVKKSKPDDGLAEHLLKFEAQTRADDSTKISINFALGKVFDDQKNYTQAFKHYAVGNALKNERLNYSAEEDEARFSKLIETFDTTFFQKHQHLGVESNLPVIIAGMPRSATTLTEQIISSHPSVIGAGEVMFWSRTPIAMPLRLGTATSYPECVSQMQAEHAKDIAAMYEATLRKIAGTNSNPQHITDKMPHNFLNVGLIALLFPNVKIIHTKRDPIDTCLSIFFQNFNDAHPYAFDLKNLGFHYQQYERIMRHWHTVLPGRILDINYADTIADPEYWSRQLIAHIGLKWDEACLSPHKLERSVKTASHWQVRQPIYKTSIERWRNYEEFLEPLKQALNLDH